MSAKRWSQMLQDPWIFFKWTYIKNKSIRRWKVSMTSCSILDLKLFLANTRSKGTRTMHTYLRCAILASVNLLGDSVSWWLKPGPLAITQHSKARVLRRICPLLYLEKNALYPLTREKKTPPPSNRKIALYLHLLRICPLSSLDSKSVWKKL